MNFNILGIGLPQLILVFGLSMLLFGPKKMIQYAYQAGRWISQLRVMWQEAAKSVQKEFHDAGLDLPTDLPMRGGRIDIGAAAMRIVEQSSPPPSAAAASGALDTVTNTTDAPFTTLAESTRLPSADSSMGIGSGRASSIVNEPSLGYPAEAAASSSPSSTVPEANTHASTLPETEQSKKYDAWLPD